MTKEQLYQEIRQLLTSLFEIEADKISLESRLYEDLDLDSIDAVDLMVYLQKKTEVAIKADAFKSVRTIGDVVDTLAQFFPEK